MATEAELEVRLREIASERNEVERAKREIEGSKKWYQQKDYKHWDSILRCSNIIGELSDERREVEWRLQTLRTTGHDPRA